MSASNALRAAATGEQQNPVTVFRGFLEKQKPQLAAALPKHVSPDRMIRLACTEFAKNPLLQKCTPVSVFGAIIQASQLGLEIGVLGQAYLVPYRNTKNNTYEAQFIPGYKGLIGLARRSGEVTSIETNIVYANDRFDLKLGLETSVDHVPNLDGDRGAHPPADPPSRTRAGAPAAGAPRRAATGGCRMDALPRRAGGDRSPRARRSRRPVRAAPGGPGRPSPARPDDIQTLD
jgi:hypothetical protein